MGKKSCSIKMKDGYLDFDEYIVASEPHKREKAETWKVAIGLQAVFFPIDNTTLLPLRGEFGGHSPIPRTMSLANSLPPFQGVCGRCAPKGQPSSSPTATPWDMIAAITVSTTNVQPTAPKGQ